MVPTHEQELRNLAGMWKLQADDIDGPDPETGEEPIDLDEDDQSRAETLRHCAHELETLLNEGVLVVYVGVVEE